MAKKGVALIIGIVTLIILTALVAGFVIISNIRSRVVRNTLSVEQAHQIADAGTQKTLQTLIYYIQQENQELTDILVNCSNCPLHTKNPFTIRDDFLTRKANGEYNWYYSLEDTTIVDTSTAPAQFGANIPFRKGAYHIIFEDNDDGDANLLNDTDGYIFAYVVGTYEDGAVRQIRCMIRHGMWFIPDSAVISGGSIKIAGNPSITGGYGNVRSNIDINIQGDPLISQNVIASGKVNLTGSPDIGGEIIEGAPPISLPETNFDEFYQLRNFLFTDDGRIYNAPGELLFDASTGGQWNGFSFTTGRWKQNGAENIPQGVYYFQTDVEIAGNTQMTATIFSEGNVELLGSAQLTPYYYDLLIVSNYDVRIAGNTNLFELQGVIVAVEQVSVRGTSRIQGSLISKDERDESMLVQISSEISLELAGNVLINYDGEPLEARLKLVRSDVQIREQTILH